MKPEEDIPTSAKLQEDHDRLMWRLWCITVALIAIGGLFWGGVLVVNYPPSYPTKGDRHPASPPVTVRPVESIVRPAESFATRKFSPAPYTGPGIVWVNTWSKVYHFPGYRWYGHTLRGKYASEENAIAEGDRAAKNERRPLTFDAVKQ